MTTPREITVEDIDAYEEWVKRVDVLPDWMREEIFVLARRAVSQERERWPEGPLWCETHDRPMEECQPDHGEAVSDCPANTPDAPLSQGEEITPCDTQFTKRWGWWCSAHNKPAWKAHDGNYYCQNMGAEMAQTINLVGDRWDTVAGKIIADAELDEMRGSVIANLCDEIASALRNVHADGCEKIADGVASLIAERDELVKMNWGLLAERDKLLKDRSDLAKQIDNDTDCIVRLKDRVSELTRLLDNQLGTPCEQMRHEQETAKLVERVNVLERALKHILSTDSDGNSLSYQSIDATARAALRTSEEA